MFLHLLNDPQQKAFLALAKQFVACDNHLAAEERNLLELMYAEAGLDFDEELPGGDTETLLAAFDTPQARAAVLLELIGVGHADQEFHARESALVQQVARAFQTPPEKVAAMESWVTRQLALAQEAEQFWSE